MCREKKQKLVHSLPFQPLTCNEVILQCVQCVNNRMLLRHYHLAALNTQPHVLILCSYFFFFFLKQMMGGAVKCVEFVVFNFLVCLLLDKVCEQFVNSPVSGFCVTVICRFIFGKVVPLVEFLRVILPCSNMKQKHIPHIFSHLTEDECYTRLFVFTERFLWVHLHYHSGIGVQDTPTVPAMLDSLTPHSI